MNPSTYLEKKKSPIENTIAEQNFLVDNQNFFKTDGSIPFCDEWTSLYDIEKIQLNTSIKHPFTITLLMKYASFIDPADDLNVARVFLGIKNEQIDYRESIGIGLYMGRLYFRDIFDYVSLSKEKLVEGINLVLTVCPTLNGKSDAILRAIDQTGNILAEIKTSKMLSTDWNGQIAIGAHFKSLRIEGVQSTY